MNVPVVLDSGSGFTKAGFAGQETPLLVIPSQVGRIKHSRAMAGAVEGDLFVGNRLSQLKGLLKLSNPINHGIIQNYDDVESIWLHVYDHLKVPSQDHPLLFTVPPLNPIHSIDSTAQILFETFNVPSLFFSIQAVLALYAGGRTVLFI